MYPEPMGIAQTNVPKRRPIRQVLAEMGVETNPYAGFDASQFNLDLHGWHSTHPLFEQVIANRRPEVIIEIGTWYGASAIHMGKLLRKHSIAGTIVCVDTWLGNLPLMRMEHYRRLLKRTHGMPSIYPQFLANVIHSKLQETLLPIPMTSVVTGRALRRERATADFVYVDGSHNEQDVATDLAIYWELLAPGGVMMGDDYTTQYRGVVNAVNRFANEKGLKLLTNREKWLLEHPASSS
ncbi:Cephalosporin hydroxylase [Planctomycetes bacterium Pan216]|uniref:Cephalosporin hydroxylase n=1 Tax=Kolteria novifilia TaxID=2527975 RepID=A0A518B449_9BACT|nr:Cephalosporin hydroxylase [Planctomycetes bacterium Pan216]